MPRRIYEMMERLLADLESEDPKVRRHAEKTAKFAERYGSPVPPRFRPSGPVPPGWKRSKASGTLHVSGCLTFTHDGPCLCHAITPEEQQGLTGIGLLTVALARLEETENAQWVDGLRAEYSAEVARLGG